MNRADQLHQALIRAARALIRAVREEIGDQPQYIRVYTAARDAVTQELERITAENDGVLTAEQVVAEARPKNSPLHGLFEWDNKAASEQWQRRQL